ncbi:hypothetical protein TNCV_4690241 [Trichonephila clavipes]|nr:hypothetical protein TNCV_4690241 [Trichonephila clavipes]
MEGFVKKDSDGSSNLRSISRGSRTNSYSNEELVDLMIVTKSQINILTKESPYVSARRRNEKVSNHGSIPITLDCNVVAFIVFEEGFHQPIKRTKQSIFLDVTVLRHTLVD